MKIFGYVLVIIGTLIGGVTLLFTLVATSAPQQAAGAAIAVAWAVLPYCFARAVEKLSEVTVSEALERHWRREHGETAVQATVQQATQDDPKKKPQLPKFHPLTGQRL